MRTLKNHSGAAVMSLAFSPDGQILASGLGNGTILLWHVTDDKSPVVLQGAEGSVWSVAFSSSGQILASGSADCTVRLWQVDGTLLHTLKEHTGPVLGVAFLPDGQTLVSGARDGTVRLWQVTSGRPLCTLDTLGEFAGLLEGVALSSAEDLSSESRNEREMVWSLTDECVRFLGGHLRFLCVLDEQDTIYSVSFSPDGRFLAIGVNKGTVCLYRADLVALARQHRKGV
jgi:WD40 repeat protein